MFELGIDWEKIPDTPPELSPKTIQVIDAASSIFSDIQEILWERLKEMSPTDRAYYAGRVAGALMFEVALALGTAGLANGAAKAGKAGKLAKLAKVLDSIPGLTPAAKAKIIKAVTKAIRKLKASRRVGRIDGMADISKLARGRKGGAILDAKWRQQLVAQLKSLDPNLKLRIDDDFLELKGLLGGFQPQSGTVILRSDATLFEAVHELGHAKYFADIGSDATKYLDDVSSVARELEAWRYVLDYAEKYPGRFTVDELDKARSMFNEEFYKMFGVLPK